MLVKSPHVVAVLFMRLKTKLRRKEFPALVMYISRQEVIKVNVFYYFKSVENVIAQNRLAYIPQ